MKKILALTMVVLLSLGLFGCQAFDSMRDLVSEEEDIEIVRSGEEGAEASTDANMRDTVLYYKNETGYVVPVKRQIPWEEGIAKAALRNMIDSQVVREDLSLIGLEPVIPAGTQIKGMSIKDGLCRVNFTNEFLSYQDQQHEEALVKAVVYTLTEFPAIEEVRFMVEDKEINTLEYGTDVSNPIRRENINAVGQAQATDSDVVVYYKSTSNGHYEYYVPVTVPVGANESEVFTSLEKLFEGPESAGLYTDIPQGVYFQGIEIRDGIAFVDVLTESQDTIADQLTFDRMAKNIGLTLRQFEEVANVEILIGGKTVEEAGLDLSSPETIPTFANEY